MKIVFLNVWNAEVKEPFENFIAEESHTTDIFCFQETFDNALAVSRKALPNYAASTKSRRTEMQKDFATTVYMRHEFVVLDSGVLLEDVAEGALAQWFVIEVPGQTYYLANVHGLPWPGDKLDVPQRIYTSQVLTTHAAQFQCPRIIGGDFNLNENTQSVQMFERAGYKNLVREYKIETTRNRYCWDKYPTR